MVPVERIELPTFGLQNRCSTAELNRLRYWVHFSGFGGRSLRIALGREVPPQFLLPKILGATVYGSQLCHVNAFGGIFPVAPTIAPGTKKLPGHEKGGLA